MSDATKTSLVEHPLFIVLKPWLFKMWSNKTQVGKDPIYRVEVSRDIPPELLALAVEIELPCVKCGRPHNPIRRRMRTNTEGVRVYEERHYVAVACPPSINNGCSRGDSAKLELARIAEQVVERTAQRRRGEDQ